MARFRMILDFEFPNTPDNQTIEGLFDAVEAVCARQKGQLASTSSWRPIPSMAPVIPEGATP